MPSMKMWVELISGLAEVCLCHNATLCGTDLKIDETNIWVTWVSKDIPFWVLISTSFESIFIVVVEGN